MYNFDVFYRKHLVETTMPWYDGKAQMYRNNNYDFVRGGKKEILVIHKRKIQKEVQQTV